MPKLPDFERMAMVAKAAEERSPPDAGLHDLPARQPGASRDTGIARFTLMLPLRYCAAVDREHVCSPLRIALRNNRSTHRTETDTVTSTLLRIALEYGQIA